MELWRNRMLLLLLSVTLMMNRLPAADHPVRYLGIENGLSNNAVINIYQDRKGFMWFGTYDGLNRYDGYRFKVYRNRVGDSTSLVDNGIYTIEGDGQHRLWIGGRKGASVFDPATERFSAARYMPAGSTASRPVSGNIHVIKAGRDGMVLIGTENSGLLLFEGNIHTGRQIPLQEGGRASTDYEVTGIDLAADGRSAWVAVQGRGLCWYDAAAKTLRILNGTPGKVNCLKAGAGGQLWLGTDEGLFRYDPRSNTFSPDYMPEHCNVVALCIDRQGALWIGSDGNGLLVLYPGREKASPFPAPGSRQQLSSNAVYSLYEDREGRKWIGTLRGGINIIDPRPQPFELHAFHDDSIFGSINNFIFSFCEDKTGNIWVGTDGGGLKYWNREQNTYTRYTRNRKVPGSLSSNFITSILCDAQGDIWLSTWFGGVNRFHKAGGAFERFPCFNPYTGATENNVWLVYEDAARTLWASTTNNGTLYTFNRAAGRFELFDNAIANVQCLAEDSRGRLWGGNYHALIQIDRQYKQHRFFDIGYTVRSIHEDRQGRLWVGTDGGGLLLFNTETGAATRFTDTDGLPSNTILRILEDDKGRLWLSTYNGLSRFDPAGPSFRNFSQSDGLQSNQFAYNAALKLRSGELMFGGIKGFNIFYPDSLYEREEVPPVLLTGLKINNAPIRPDTQYVRIPYNEAVLSLDFVALEYSSPDKISYAYYLEGWDKDWNYVGELRNANYTRLQEGSYTFKIKAANAGGTWGPEVRALRITVLPPWYRAWWAWLLYTACAAAGIYFYISYKARQERLKYEIKLAHLENEKEKELNERRLTFFTNISHEFRTPLTLIINPLKERLQNREADGSEKELNVVYRNARRLLSLVDQLLLFRKADTEGDRLQVTALNLVELCREVYLCFSQQARARNITYRFSAGSEQVTLYADHEKLEIALFNLLSNAFKFTPDGGAILFALQETGASVNICISDSGCGIPEGMGDRVFEKFRRANAQEHKKTGFGIGLYLVKHFIESHQGSIAYRSGANEGTTFLIRLQKGKAHLPGAHLAPGPAGRSGILEELAEGAAIAPQKGKKALPDPPVAAPELLTEKRSILLIDDNAEIREYLQQLFAAQFILYEADNARDGFALVQKHLPDLVISDIQMEGMDGVELCARIKQTDSLSHIPVILLTSASSADTQIKGLAEGADDYITKPFEKELLLAKVDNILKNRYLLRQYFLDQITLKHTSIKVPAEYRDFLDRCIRIVETNLGNEDFSIKTFALAIGMSHSSLYKKVKSISGQTVNAFIRSIRLRKAAVLMLREHYTINQAAQQVGINDIKYFREQFCKLFGMNPSEYIKKYRHSFNGDLNVIKI
ncbi:two-component regulator propeller domain-containing protein [Chitinophaga japonensis]|uniref:histidine kinase n=1 Tax=Chitinophaga japonensis TaxID=104662 RepID=A0A562T612_CHIJA|nr:two-component regulator propeller domain-containing protein [Chitinophaga japonensis]TWI88979.1 signal transduction histidine kinase [Chitinophaga japonensis]